MLNKIKEIICEYVDVDPAVITENSFLRNELGASSFDLMNIAVAIEDEFTYRVAVGAVLEPSFRVLRSELAAWGEEAPLQWSFTLKVSSAESTREPFFLEELSFAHFGEELAQRYEFSPGPLDHVVMDNEYATVYVTGWQVE